jgi:hypothetical protein
MLKISASHRALSMINKDVSWRRHRLTMFSRQYRKKSLRAVHFEISHDLKEGYATNTAMIKAAIAV